MVGAGRGFRLTLCTTIVCCCVNLAAGLSILPTDATCSAHGERLLGKCVCDSQWMGETCEFEIEKKVAAVPGEAAPAKALGAWKKAIADAKDPSGLTAAVEAVQKTAMKTCPDNCNGQGHCDEVYGTCTCELGYHGGNCGNFCPNLCSGQGHCMDGQCVCFGAWTGLDCGTKACCSGHGDCTIPGNSSVCVCHDGWTGPQCSMPLMCPKDPTGQQCSGKGNCVNGTCNCTGGFGGLLCADPPKECGVCPKGGTCNRVTGKCQCGGGPCGSGAVSGLDTGGGAAGAAPAKAAAAGKKKPALKKMDQGSHASDVNCNNGKFVVDTCECDKGWRGAYCTVKMCPVDDSGIECNGKGLCVGGKCRCSSGFGMLDKTVEDSCQDQICMVDCGSHGSCEKGQCVCNAGFRGPACRQPDCSGGAATEEGDDGCNKSGFCFLASPNSPAECRCDKGFAGARCERKAVSTLVEIFTCKNSCNGKGLCAMGKCICSAGWSGRDCSERMCNNGKIGPACAITACLNNCTGKGICLNDESGSVGTCECSKGYGGPDCSIPEECAEECSSLCGRDTRSVECLNCTGRCKYPKFNAQQSQRVRGEPLKKIRQLFKVMNAKAIKAAANATLKQLQVGQQMSRGTNNPILDKVAPTGLTAEDLA